MWSLGIVLYALLLGGFPFYADDPLLMRDQILSGKLRFPKWLSMPARELIVSMLHRHPERRADIFDVSANRESPCLCSASMCAYGLFQSRAGGRERVADAGDSQSGVAHDASAAARIGWPV